ncbi:hypothetical protein SAMN04489712_103355 [Thermomonospora echinospora]|uniref:5-bromo-4-chloroindolyl phosphate hydrolysis protein n=1 Tax=Thermomonospora echinospora TaxID=1992 RepID=A0A1H5XPW5_9ACTN|nr:hypothetical protein [Thermomonospora echinospora]SEG13799.1 hypothetical protein SAMN04489712_103355 [Thermomonospora echinospora]
MAISDRLVRYLGSTKNLVGSACGLAGLGLHAAGMTGSSWPFVVAGLYAAGALAAPPERVTLVVAGAEDEIERLRADLDRLVERVAAHAGRMPPPAMVRLKEIRDTLDDLLARPDPLAADPRARQELIRAVRTDLPAGFETYLNLPGWFAAGRGRTTRRTAADELVAQLDLIAEHVTELAGRLLEAEAQRMRDQTRRLRDRSRRDA